MSEESVAKLGRPVVDDEVRSKQMSFACTPMDDTVIRRACAKAGVKIGQFLLDAALAAARSEIGVKPTFPKSVEVVETVDESSVQKMSVQNAKTVQKKTVQKSADGKAKDSLAKSSSVPAQNLEDELELSSIRPTRTSADARAIARAEDPKNRNSTGSSLRSSQRDAVSCPADEPDDLDPPTDSNGDPDPEAGPWKLPAELKLTIKISTGETVNNTWLFANACRMPAADVTRLLTTSSYKPLKRAMLHCFARSLRDCYKAKWCSAYRKLSSAWIDTWRSNMGFMKAAEHLAQEYASRGMSAHQFLEAAEELRPKSLRIVTTDLLGGTIGARVAAWLPPEQRTHDKAWGTHEDSEGQMFVTMEPGGDPIPVIRNAADRERLLKKQGIR